MEVYEDMVKKFPGVSYNTIYRNLSQFFDIGILEQFHFPDGVKFRACDLSSHHHHAICLQCKKTFSLKFCPVDNPLGLPDSFQITDHNFEIYGYCEDCR